MKKIIWSLILLLVLIVGGFYIYIKLNPPLDINTLAMSGDQKSVVVGVGNKGIIGLTIVDIQVNNNEKPKKAQLQVNNASNGFVVTDEEYNFDADKYHFTDIDEVTIKTGTSTTLEKFDNGTVTENDKIYGVSVFHDEQVSKVHINYSYFGKKFTKTVKINSIPTNG